MVSVFAKSRNLLSPFLVLAECPYCPLYERQRSCYHESDNLSRMPPGKEIDDWYTVLRSGMWRLYFQLSSEGRQRYYNELLPLLHDTKAEVLGERDENAYYLVYLGTKPHARGRGYARKLLQTMIARVRPNLPPPPPKKKSDGEFREALITC